MVRDIMNLSSAVRDKSPFTEEIRISEDRPARSGFRHLSPQWSYMYPQLRYCLNQQRKQLAGIMKRCREERINMLQTSCDGEQPKCQRVIVYTIPQPTVLGTTFITLSNRLIITTEERKVPKSKTWILKRSNPMVTCQSPKQRWEGYQTRLLNTGRNQSYRWKICDQELSAHPRAEVKIMYSS